MARAADILGLKALLGRFPRELSGGQRQRVAMGRAIVRDPAVFLFDEPLSNLDAKLRVQMRAEIRSLQQRLASTTVYVTHDQIEAMTMADKIVVLRDGFVEQIGSPLELYDRPANMFVAGFIGSPAMNLIKGRLTAEGEPRFQLWRRPLGSAEPRPARRARARRRARRAARTYLARRPRRARRAGFGGRADRRGNLRQCDARRPGNRLRFARPRESPPGADMLLSFDAEKLHVFDPETGAALVD